MLHQPVLQVRGLSKTYIIGHKKKHNTLRDGIVDTFKSLLGSKGSGLGKAETFHALDNVSFDVYKGETLGVIGGNGAGKSTLLKILSKIVEPTEGTITSTGRIASLLEVGTGFHPELTGRENVFFNGSILGMSRKEITAKFDEIVAFAEIEKFIDTPVKYYSSGMYVRLAFAIAAHLDPDILIIDEALAVGDYAFQQKCIEKMRTTARSGKTVIFVSHAMSIVEDLCDRAIYLDKGKLTMEGDVRQVVSTYLGKTVKSLSTSWRSAKGFGADTPVVAYGLHLEDAATGKPISKTIPGNHSIKAVLDIDVRAVADDISLGISVIAESGLHMLRTAITDEHLQELKLSKGRCMYEVILPSGILRDGEYIIALDCDQNNTLWHHNPYFTEARTRVLIKSSGDNSISEWGAEREGIIKVRCQWSKIKVAGKK